MTTRTKKPASRLSGDALRGLLVILATSKLALPVGGGIHAARALGQLPPLIPREVLFGNPDRANPRLSPDGRRIAYLAPDHGTMNLWINTVGLPDDWHRQLAGRVITQDRNRGIRRYVWAENSKQILYIQDKAGDEDWHVYCVTLESGEVRDMTPFDGVQARIIALSPKHPDEALVALNRRDPRIHDIYRLNLESGTLSLQYENKEGFVAWTADPNLSVRAALKLLPNGGTALWVRENGKTAWRTLLTWDPEDILNSGPIAFTPDGGSLYLVSSKGTDMAQLRQIDLTTRQEKLLARDRRADVSGVLLHPVSRTIQAVAFDKQRLHWKVLDPQQDGLPSIRRDLRAIRRTRRGDFRVIDRDNADKTWLVSFTADDSPVNYYTYDRKTRQATWLYSNRSALEDLELAKSVPISFMSRDGWKIHGYFTKPPGLDAHELPMVLLIHGGPWSRDTWGYNGTVQWLANRGYAVLRINYRGSRGYGKRFLNAANRDWGGAMQNDLIDGVQWAIEKGLADPKRVAVFGKFYGGYATLVSLAFTPEMFCCGVDVCGPSNLISFVKAVPPYWKPLEPLWFDRIGHPERDAELLKSRSPLFHVQKITKPLLIFQGANDPRVKAAESLQMVEALRAAGKEVEYVEYPDEGHGFTMPANKLDFYARTEEFFARHLGGRYERSKRQKSEE